MTTLTTASVLAFERKLEISDAIFTQIDSQKADAKITNVIIRKKGVRGTISNRHTGRRQRHPDRPLELQSTALHRQTERV